jgi:hypothetical protein
MTDVLFDAPAIVARPSATKVFLCIEVPEGVITPDGIWPHGGPGDEGWDVNSVVSELRVQYGDTVSLRTLADEWGVGGNGGELILRDDLGNIARMELRS